jgi:hypothetical protein
MEHLPYIDQHARTVNAGRGPTWDGLLRYLKADINDPASGPRGFRIGVVDVRERLELKGRHWFSTYALTFTLDEQDPQHTVVRAETRAVFPGVAGQIYRTLVIRSGGHKIVVRTMLRRIAKTATDNAVRR